MVDGHPTSHNLTASFHETATWIDGIRSRRTSVDELWPKGIRCTIYRFCGKKYHVGLDKDKFKNYYKTRTNHNNRQSGAAVGV
jgi:hypothetical protein